MRYVLVLLLAWFACTVAGAAGVGTTPTITFRVMSPVVSTPDYRTHLIHWEGLRYGPYRDPSGEGLCVGVGHRARNGRLHAVYGHDEVETLYRADLRKALRTARAGVVAFDTLPPEARQLVVGVIWTCGSTGFHRFRRFRAALSRRDYTRAARELRASRWYRQEGDRGVAYVASLQRL